MTTDEPIEAAVCVTPSAERAEECAIVLASNGIAHRLETTGTGWLVIVAAGDGERASQVLVEYDRENRAEGPSDPSPPPYGTTWIGGSSRRCWLGSLRSPAHVGPTSGLTKAAPLPGRFCRVRCGARSRP